MLLNFEVENWTCFRGKAGISMQAGPEHDPHNRLLLVGAESRPLKILPVAVVYGNNASGKTQLIRALRFVQDLVVGKLDDAHLPVEPYAFDPVTETAPSRFVVQFVIGETVYELKLLVSSDRIVSEELFSYGVRATSRKPLFKRSENKIETFGEWGGDDLRKYVGSLTIAPTKSFISVSAMFLAKTPVVAQVLDWFMNTLHVITQEARYVAVEDYCEPGDIAARTHEYLERFDVGIKKLVPEVVQIDSFSTKILSEVRKQLASQKTVRRILDRNVFIFDIDEKKTLRARKLFAMHECQDGSQKPLPMDCESDGTRRMLDLVPAVASAMECHESSVFVIDEIDRSLHHLVTRALVEDFIASCRPAGRAQLIFTTHDLLLMTQDIFRRDEMNVTDKAPDGAATICSISDFEGLKSDTKILPYYLDGRFGGIPRGI